MSSSEHNHRMPADEGLSGLGLVMQLAGGLFAAMTAYQGLAFLIMTADVPMEGAFKLWVFLLVVLGVVRSVAHRSAGHELLYGGRPIAAVWRYVVLGLIHTVVWIGFLRMSLEVPWKAAAPLIFTFAAWPVTLAILMSRPRIKAIDGPLATPRDGGYEGAGALMVVLGLCGVLWMLVMTMVLFEAPKAFKEDAAWKLMLAVVLMLVVRSVIHLRAAAHTLGHRNLDITLQSTTAYGNFGALSSLIAGAVFLIIAIKAKASFSETLVTVAGIAAMLLVWPLAIRRFVTERRFVEGADVSSNYQMSSDRGLSSLGWLLLALGVVSMASALPTALWREAAGGGGNDLLDSVMTFGTDAVPGRSLWWPVVIAGLQIWAALELIGMTPRYKLAALGYGAVASVLTLYLNWPILKELDEVGGEIGSMASMGFFGGVALSLIIPMATLALATRQLPEANPRELDRVFQ